MSNPFHVGDPVVDLAQGRPMIVLDAPDETVAEWSEANNYQLEENYANGKLGAEPDEAVVRCVYVSDIRSEPSKDYTFPVSRVALIDAHHADDGRRVYERVVRGFIASLFAFVDDDEIPDYRADLKLLAGDDVVSEALELAKARGAVAEYV